MAETGKKRYMGRVKYAARNIFFGYLGNAVTGILGIALQKIFIIRLGTTLLGVNSTYTSILSSTSACTPRWRGGTRKP